MKLPKVSIIIPVFNGSDFLSDAIRSALSQTYANTEVIVINDGSNDSGKTKKIALSYGEKIKYFYKKNGGVASALNLGIEKMSGEYFSWLSHDDLYHPEKIQSQINYLLKLKKRNTVVYSDYEIFSEAFNFSRKIKIKEFKNFRYFLTIKNELNGCTLIVPRKAFFDCGVFNINLKTTQDYEMWFRIASRYTFHHLGQILVKSRAHSNQGSLKMKSLVLQECDNLLADSVMKLSESEIRAGGNGSLLYGYSKIYESMYLRGFTKSSNLAFKLSINNLFSGLNLASIKSIFILTKLKFCILKIIKYT